MNLLKRKLNKWFGWYNMTKKITINDLLDPSVKTELEKVNNQVKELTENLKKLKNELQTS